MPPDSNTHTRPQGVFITLEAIYQTVTSIDDKIDTELKEVRKEVAQARKDLDAEITRLKVQVSALWVVYGIMLAGLTTVVTTVVSKGFTP